MPSLSNASVSTLRLAVYSARWVSKYLRSTACSRPAAAASCKGELAQKTIRVDAANVGLIIDGGPISHPTRQPVAAKASKNM